MSDVEGLCTACGTKPCAEHAPKRKRKQLAIASDAWKLFAIDCKGVAYVPLFDAEVALEQARAKHKKELEDAAKELETAQGRCAELLAESFGLSNELDDTKAQMVSAVKERDEEIAELRLALADNKEQLELLSPGGLYAWKSKYEALLVALVERDKSLMRRTYMAAVEQAEIWGGNKEQDFQNYLDSLAIIP